MNLKESEDGYKETTKIKSTYQQRDRSDRKTEIERVYPPWIVNGVIDDKDF